jgi:hypothetical protein
MDYQRKREGWKRALKKYLATNKRTLSLRTPDVPFETKLQMAASQAKYCVPTLVSREFDLLWVWEEHKDYCICMCACGDPAEILTQRLVTGAKDCGHKEREARRIAAYRRAQKTKLRAKVARAYRKRWGVALPKDIEARSYS